MIEVKNLTKKYGNNTAVKNLSFTVEKGKIYGFLGPNGAGKSTTMNIITGCLAATEGQVLINGHDIFEEPKEAKKCIGYLPELPPIYPDMTPYEYLMFVAEAKGVARDLLYNEVMRVMEATQIVDVGDRLIKNLSKGFKQRVGIAQAMLGMPEIIILDEPTVGLDPKQIIEIRELIKSLGKDHTVILSSHILSEVSAVCDYVMIIAHGTLVASSEIENLGQYLVGSTATTLVAKGDKERIENSLSSLPGVIVKSVKKDEREADDVYTYVLEAEKDTDVREAIFKKIVDIGCIILNMDTKTMGLEEVFLKLTDEEAEVYKAQKEAEKSEKANRKKKVKEAAEEKKVKEDKDDGSEYTSLFSISDNFSGSDDSANTESGEDKQ